MHAPDLPPGVKAGIAASVIFVFSFALDFLLLEPKAEE